MSMTVRQCNFVQNVLSGMTGIEAARKAGFSAKSAQSQAAKLLSNPEVAAAINEVLKRRGDRVEIDADHILRELARVGLSDLGDAFDERGLLKPISELPLDVRRAIQSVEVEDIFEGSGRERERVGVLTKVKFWDKVKGLELLGKNLKLFTDVHEHHLGKGLAERMKKARERVATR